MYKKIFISSALLCTTSALPTYAYPSVNITKNVTGGMEESLVCHPVSGASVENNWPVELGNSTQPTNNPIHNEPEPETLLEELMASINHLETELNSLFEEGGEQIDAIGENVMFVAEGLTILSQVKKETEEEHGPFSDEFFRSVYHDFFQGVLGQLFRNIKKAPLSVKKKLLAYLEKRLEGIQETYSAMQEELDARLAQTPSQAGESGLGGELYGVLLKAKTLKLRIMDLEISNQYHDQFFDKRHSHLLNFLSQAKNSATEKRLSEEELEKSKKKEEIKEKIDQEEKRPSEEERQGPSLFELKLKHLLATLEEMVAKKKFLEAYNPYQGYLTIGGVLQIQESLELLISDLLREEKKSSKKNPPKKTKARGYQDDYTEYHNPKEHNKYTYDKKTGNWVKREKTGKKGWTLQEKWEEFSYPDPFTGMSLRQMMREFRNNASISEGRFDENLILSSPLYRAFLKAFEDRIGNIPWQHLVEEYPILAPKHEGENILADIDHSKLLEKKQEEERLAKEALHTEELTEEEDKVPLLEKFYDRLFKTQEEKEEKEKTPQSGSWMTGWFGKKGNPKPEEPYEDD